MMSLSAPISPPAASAPMTGQEKAAEIDRRLAAGDIVESISTSEAYGSIIRVQGPGKFDKDFQGGLSSLEEMRAATDSEAAIAALMAKYPNSGIYRVSW